MKKSLIIIGVLCAAHLLEAGVLGAFDFEDGMGASHASPGVVLSDLQYSSGALIKGATIETGASGSKVLKIKGSDTQGTTGDAFANNNYLFLTVTSDRPISLDSITVDMQGFDITSFVNSRIYSDRAGHDDLVGDTIGAIGFKGKGDFPLETQTINLVDPSANLLNGTGTTTEGFSDLTKITFYVPFTDNANAASHYVEIDNLTINFSVSPNAVSPENEETDVESDTTLQWKAPALYTPVYYDVYFGDNKPNLTMADYGLTKVVDKQNVTSYDPPEEIRPGSTYYWVVDAYEPGPDPILRRGNTWTFTASPAPFSLDLKAPINKWDEAIPLGNGRIGGLLWGDENEIRLSLDRADLWDTRPFPIYANPKFKYKTVIELAQAGKTSELNSKYSKSNLYPTKLSGGRLVLTLSPEQKAESFHLDMKDALGTVVMGDEKVECFFSQVESVALLKIPGKRPDLKIIANAAAEKIGHKAAVHGSDDDSVWFVSDTPTGFQYVVYAKYMEIPGGTLIATTITTNEDAKDPLALASENTHQALKAGYAKVFAEHKKWWADFWSKSSVHVPHAKIQNHYNLVQYFYGAASRRGAPPIALQGLWTADDGGLPPWRGDYHHDLNTELTYWAYYTSGRFEQGHSFLDFMWDLKPSHEKWAKEFWDVDGFVVPGIMSLDGKPMGSWFQYTLTPSSGVWVAQAFHWQWLYTMDEKFLRERAYPYCKGVADSLVDLMERDKDGKLKLPLSTSPEIHQDSQAAWFTPNTNYDLSLARWVFEANAEMAAELGKTSEVARWEMLLSKMDDYAVEGEAGKLLIAPHTPLTSSHRHFSHLMAIHPLGILNVDGTERDNKIIDASLAQIEKLGTSAWCGYSFSWMACMQARTGNSEKALLYLDYFVNSFILRNGFHCNGEQTRKGLSNFHYRPFTLEGNFAAGQTVHEMLLQSWGGRVRVFPAVPKSWKDASFEDLRAEGGYIISASRSKGETDNITITATVKTTLRLKDPFNGKTYESNLPVKHAGDELTCVMKAGETLKLTGVSEEAPSIGQ